jgi:betaine-homocysteine S-methyltransferase
MLGAEGYVFELERRGYIKAGPYVPEVVLDFPGAVRELHREFLRAGADVRSTARSPPSRCHTEPTRLQ